MWRVVIVEGRAVIEIGGFLMISWLWHAWCLGMFLCKGTGCSAAVAMPCMRRLCKSPASSDLDLRHPGPGKEGTPVLDATVLHQLASPVLPALH